MQQFSSTRAKQNFGQLMKAASIAPVAIERHGEVRAILAAPMYFSSGESRPDAMAPRLLARLNQRLTEQSRLIRHQRVAIDLVTLPAAARNTLIGRAQAVVDRWRQERLCSADYIDRWSEILRLPAREMALRMVSDMDGWGAALRQNSPWVGVHA